MPATSLSGDCFCGARLRIGRVRLRNQGEQSRREPDCRIRCEGSDPGDSRRECGCACLLERVDWCCARGQARLMRFESRSAAASEICSSWMVESLARSFRWWSDLASMRVASLRRSSLVSGSAAKALSSVGVARARCISAVRRPRVAAASSALPACSSFEMGMLGLILEAGRGGGRRRGKMATAVR
jgi:hypothetical protein